MIQLHQCPRLWKADNNTLDMCVFRKGHAFLRTMTYKNGEWDGMCLRCGLRAHFHGREIVEIWGIRQKVQDFLDKEIGFSDLKAAISQ